MQQQYHILNGDSLRQSFPQEIKGERIVARECLVDGDIGGDDLRELYETRAEFISTAYSGYSREHYYKSTVPEFDKIQALPDNADISLWFEDDLFCQVNCWFVLHLLKESGYSSPIWLVRPTTDIEYGFGTMSPADLIEAYKQRMRIDLSEFEQLRRLWRHYQHNRYDDMLQIADTLNDRYPFLLPAVRAHIDRSSVDSSSGMGRLEHSVATIMSELQTDKLGPVFREFNKRESIYGLGDIQVKRIIDTVKGIAHPDS